MNAKGTLFPGAIGYPRHLEIAYSYLGVKETPGREATPEILFFLDHCRRLPHHLKDKDETNWCAAFASTCLHLAHLPSPLTSWARAFLHWGQNLEVPYFGCVVILKRGGKGQPGPERLDAPGHVGFWVGEEPDRVRVLGGNQGNAVTEAWFPAERILGYRGPLVRPR